MATPIPTPNHIIIWLDQYIGLLGSDEQLKTGVSEQADPENPLPESPWDKDIKYLAQLKAGMDQSFENIPKNLEAFSTQEECLQCIGESLKNNKEIFFITSGTMGEKIVPVIMENYPSLKTIYVFCGYYKAHLEWVQNCYYDHNVICHMFNFPTDLLARLLRDVAEYFKTQGDDELNRSQQLAYSAIKYFRWAKLLLERANSCDKKKLLDKLKEVESRIESTEQLIKKLNGDVDVKESEEPFK